MSAPSNNLVWLQALFESFSNGDWEHGDGCKIESLDNPGWYLTFDLAGTPLDGIELSRIEIERSEHDWFKCWRENGAFHAACGPRNLDEVLSVFRDWVTGNGVVVDEEAAA